MFAGGFDLAAACAVAGSGDELFALDFLDALVRKSLLVADRSSGRTRLFDVGDNPPIRRGTARSSGDAEDARDRTRPLLRSREADVFALWDSPRQREAYEWLTRELANLRTAFRWAADYDDLDTGATIACYAWILGLASSQFEPDGLGRGTHRTRALPRIIDGSYSCA